MPNCHLSLDLWIAPPVGWSQEIQGQLRFPDLKIDHVTVNNSDTITNHTVGSHVSVTNLLLSNFQELHH